MDNETMKEVRYLVGEAWKGPYDAAEPYGLANVVQDTNGLSIYRSRKSGNTGHPLTDQDWWFKIIDLSSIKSASDIIVALNSSIATAEQGRVTAEGLRSTAEEARQTSEAARQTAESNRSSAETTRGSNESQRQNAETSRSTAEASRQSAETSRQTAENSRSAAETLRDQAESARATAENSRASAETERHTQYTADHTQAGNDHTTAGTDHTQATSDHTTAASDHTQAGTDHTRAESDHSQAASDHTTAGSDHTQATSDHTTAASDHTAASSDHTQAGTDHTRAESDHTRAESDHASIADKVSQAELEEALENFVRKGTYDASTAVGLADNIRGDVYADEQFSLRMTGGEANEVGGIGVVQVLKGAGAAIAQLFPEGDGHDFSGDVSLDGTGGNAEAPLRYSDMAGTVEMGYLLAMEAFVSQTLTQEQLDAIAAKDTGKQDRDKAVWLTPAGAITSAPTIESGQTEVTFSGWRIAMRVKASEVRDAEASSYWFTTGTAGRQVYDVAVAEGIDANGALTSFWLANGWNTGSAMEYLNHMAAQGLPTHSVKAMSALLAVTKIGIKTVKSRNLLNPQTGRALLKAYVNDADGFLGNEYTMLGGLPSGSTMAFTSLLTGKTETLTMLDATHFVIPSDGWLQITGTLPESIIATCGGEKDNTAADEYATESHTWDVTQLFGTKSGGTEGHYYRFAKEGMKGAGSACDVVELVGARGEVKVGDFDMGNASWSTQYIPNSTKKCFKTQIPSSVQPILEVNQTSRKIRCSIYAPCLVRSDTNTKVICINDGYFDYNNERMLRFNDFGHDSAELVSGHASWLEGQHLFYQLKDALTFTSLFLSASSTSDELTQMPADAIPLSEIQFADNNWSIEEAIYDSPEADANGVITPTAVTGQMRIQYSLDAAEQIDTLKKEYAALEARVTALENA